MTEWALVSLLVRLDGRKKGASNPVTSNVKWFRFRRLYLPTFFKWLYMFGAWGVWGVGVHVCLGRILFVPLSDWGCIHYVLGLAIVINQACGMRWTGVTSWSDCQASSCFAGNAKLFPMGMLFWNGRLCFTGPHGPCPIPWVLSPCRVTGKRLKSQGMECRQAMREVCLHGWLFFFL